MDILLAKLNETFPELHHLRDKKENIKAEFLHRKDNITAKFNATKGNLVGKSNLIQISIWIAVFQLHYIYRKS